jgi:hypothetical protein
MPNTPHGGNNGEVDFGLASNDARGDKGPVGLGQPFFNDYRGSYGAAAGWPLFNDSRAIGLADGSVFIAPKGRPVS